MSVPAHSPIPYSRSDVPEMDDRFTLYDATGVAILIAEDNVPDEEAEATLAYVAKAANAHPLLIARLEAASHALRSYQFGNTATDLAKDVADACDVVLAQMEGH